MAEGDVTGAQADVGRGSWGRSIAALTRAAVSSTAPPAVTHERSGWGAEDQRGVGGVGLVHLGKPSFPVVPERLVRVGPTDDMESEQQLHRRRASSATSSRATSRSRRLKRCTWWADS